jgi:amino acid adenylation domain-containing protein
MINHSLGEGRNIAHLFEQQVHRHPDAVALIADEEQLTYQQLNERANQLANYLLGLGVRIEEPVGVFAERSPHLVAAILAVLKAGGAYVPLDVDLPGERLLSIMHDAQIRALFVDARLRTRLPPGMPDPIFLDEAFATVGAEPVEFGPIELTPENLAYIVYTSGSTGKPKGVMIPHRAFMRCAYWAREVFRFTAEDRFLFKSIRAPEELFYPLFIGASVVIAPPEADRDPSLFLATIIKHGITVIGVSPAFLRLVVTDPDLPSARSLKHVLCSGEILSHELQKSFRLGCHADLYNFYGLAEAPYTTIWRCRAEDEHNKLPIGRPVDAEVFLLNSDLQPVKAGEVGEIYIGGPGLARGYLNLPDLTLERFLANPFSSNGRIYKTGDLAYHDGREDALILMGRDDLQIKVRGFRLEIGEVEEVLKSHPSVREAGVVLTDDPPGESQLTAYLVSEPGAAITLHALRNYLEPKLPDYSIPAQFCLLSSLPLTSTGKLDRATLRQKTSSEVTAGLAYVGPRNERERKLTQIWEEVLGRGPVAIHDNFFHLGGHSLSATQVIARIRSELGFELPLRALFEAPTVERLAARFSDAVHIKAPLFRQRMREGPVGLSFAQERLWFLDQLEPGSSAYHIPDAYLVNGPLDLPVLERSLRAVAQRHELLRTTLQVIAGKPAQVIAPTSDLSIPTVDRRELPENEHEAEIGRQIRRNSATVFDLAKGPLLQIEAVRLADARYLLLVNMHHVISDDWSLGVFCRELSSFYAAFLQRKPVDLPPLPIQYADYAICQREWLEKEELERQLAYWRRQLTGAPTLELPTDFPRPPRQTFVGTRIPFTLPAELTARLKAFDRLENATHFMSLLAVFQVLLSRYSGQFDIVVGTPVANRRHLELESLFGFFVNMLVLRGDLSGEPSFREIVRRLRRTALDAYHHQDLPFEKLVEELNPERDLSRPPLFQVMFALQDVPTHPLSFPGAEVTRRLHAVHATHFDLELYLSTTGDAWSGFFGFNTDLFAAATIERMIGYYQTLLESLLTSPDLPVSKATMLTSAERHQLRQWSEKPAHYGSPECIHHLFEQQAATSPELIALQYEDQTLSYRELNRRADILAGELQRIGVGRETRVGVCVERSLEMVVALLAILKAGGSYVPLDIHFPPDRITLILNDASVAVLILHDSLRPLCDRFTGAVISLDQKLAPETTPASSAAVSGKDAAYIYYTSGSAGRPKGVIIEHHSVVNFLRGMQAKPGISETDVLLALTTISFDPAVLDIFLPLSVGARVVIVPESTRLDPEQLLELLHKSGATILQATPTTWQLLMRSKWNRKELKALIGGEVLTPELAREILSCCGELWNLYGPTETTVWSTVGRIERADEITIGQPIPNQRAFIVDTHDQLVPVGVRGELLLGGAGLGRHYISQPTLTTERFVPDPFSAGPDLLYRTGDLCRYRPDGNIEFLGRIDEQVKIRGFRVEPGEIEACLIEHPSIHQCAVIDRVEKSGERRLIAYVVPAGPASVIEPPILREFLRRKLPDYMVPAAFVALESLPLTRSGKVQRNALPAPQSVQRDSATPQGVLQNPVERQLGRIWEDVLQADGIGRNDDFFEIGGHSLLAVRLMAEVNAAFGIRLPLATIFRAPTLERLAEAVQTSDELRLKPPGLITPREGEGGQRIFWAPSIGPVERFVECHNLVRLLRGQYAFYGFDPAPAFGDIENLAQHCLELIRDEQPRGPYFLAGYCQCGHVAYEIATRLERAGEEVALLAIIDCSARDLAASFRQRLYWIRDGFRGDPRHVLRRIGSFVRRRLSRANGLAAGDNQSHEQFAAHNRAISRHKVRPFSGRLDLFRSGDWLSRSPHAPTLGWDAVARSVCVHPVVCGHTAAMSDAAAVQFIAEKLRQHLPCQLTVS